MVVKLMSEGCDLYGKLLLSTTRFAISLSLLKYLVCVCVISKIERKRIFDFFCSL